MTRRPRVVVPVVVVLLSLAAALACAGPAGSGRAGARSRHPAVDPGADCAECHARSHPRIVQAWNGGAHGVTLVKCVVCHGSTAADFTLVPETSRCAGCHAAEVASAAESAQAKGCFACHEPHALAAPGTPNPHQK